jgi:transporter family protein
VWGITLKLAVKEVGLQVLVWSQAASLSLFPLYFVFFKELLPLKLDNIGGIGLAVLSGALGASGTVVLYLLLRTAPASIVVPLSALYPIVTVTLAFFILHETISLKQIAGIALALAAIWLLAT